MDPAIEAARALLPAWVQWANIILHAPIAYATTLLACALAAAVATRRRSGDARSSVRALDVLCVALPGLWTVAAVSAAGPIGRAPAWALCVAAGASSFAAAMFVRLGVRRAVRARGVAPSGRWDASTLRALGVAVALSATVAAPLRGMLGQSLSRDREVRLFAVAYTGGHDRTLADLAWVTAQRGDQRAAAVLLRAAMVAEASAVPAANLTIVLVNQGECDEAAQALREARRRATVRSGAREREILRLAIEAMRGCTGRTELVPIPSGV